MSCSTMTSPAWGAVPLPALIDLGILFFLILFVTLAFAIASTGLRSLGSWVTAIRIVVIFFTFWGYFALFEGLRQGRPPGKRWLGIRVIRDTGHGVTFGEGSGALAPPPPST